MQSNIKILLLITKKQILQVSDFCAFLCTGRCKKLGSLKLFLRQASQISRHLGPVSRAHSFLLVSILNFPQHSPWGTSVADGLPAGKDDIPYLLERQTLFPFHTIIVVSQFVLCVLVAESCPTLCDPMEFSRQKYWSGLPFPIPGRESS